MDTSLYTNRGKEVPLGVECAMPHLAHSTPPARSDSERSDRMLKLVNRDRLAANSDRLDPAHP